MKYQIDGNAHWPGSIYSAMLLGGDYSIIASSLYFDYLFSDYDIDKDEGTEYAYREGVPDGTRLYYVKIWDAADNLVYFGHAARAVNPLNSQEEYCWYYETNRVAGVSSPVFAYNNGSSRQPFGGGIE